MVAEGGGENIMLIDHFPKTDSVPLICPIPRGKKICSTLHSQEILTKKAFKSVSLASAKDKRDLHFLVFKSFKSKRSGGGEKNKTVRLFFV